MTQDVKESLTAWVTVTLMFLFFVVSMRVMDRFPPPLWLTETLQGLYWLMALTIVSRWLWRRWRIRRVNRRAD